MQPRALLLLASAAAAVGADGAVVAAATGGGVFHPGRSWEDGVEGLSPCAREAAACECRGCLALLAGWDEGKTAELSGCDGGEGCGGGVDLLVEVGAPTTRCEKVGAIVCRGLAAVAAAQEDVEEGDSSDSRVAQGWLRDQTVQELLACRVRSVGCQPDDAPCIMPEKLTGLGGSSSSAGEREDKTNVRPGTLPLLDDTEYRGAVHDMPAAAAAAAATAAVTPAAVAADGGSFGPEWATRYRRRLATSSSEASCDGIQGGSTCCSAECAECGGVGCSGMVGGAEDCCREIIEASGILCSDTGGAPPCIVDGK